MTAPRETPLIVLAARLLDPGDQVLLTIGGTTLVGGVSDVVATRDAVHLCAGGWQASLPPDATVITTGPTSAVTP